MRILPQLCSDMIDALAAFFALVYGNGVFKQNMSIDEDSIYYAKALYQDFQCGTGIEF